MNKFVKISEKKTTAAAAAAGSLLRQLLPQVLSGSISIPSFFKQGNSKDIIDLVTGSSSIKDFILNSSLGKKYGPVAEFANKLIDKQVEFIKDFFTLLEDENFQALAFAAYLEQNNLAFNPEEMYKSKAFQQLYTTKGYGGELISEGAYQRFTGRLPGIDVLPDSSTVNLENDLQKLAKQLEGVRDDLKVEKLKELLNNWTMKVSDFERFAKENYPILDSYK